MSNRLKGKVEGFGKHSSVMDGISSANRAADIRRRMLEESDSDLDSLDSDAPPKKKTKKPWGQDDADVNDKDNEGEKPEEEEVDDDGATVKMEEDSSKRGGESGGGVGTED